MTHYYPTDEKSLYYVEFERGNKKGEFTLFKRQWFHTEEELEKIKTEYPEKFPMACLCNECHPWNIFTATYGSPGCMPDETWVQFMVDALNAQIKETKKST